MTNYSQRHPLWSWKRLGMPKSQSTIGGYGCAITSLGMLANKRPDAVNEILKANGGFLQENLVIWAKAIALLGLKAGSGYPNIAHVRGQGFPMHFVVMLNKDTIIDPWDGRQKKNPYQVVGLRNVTVKALPKVVKPVTRVYTVVKGDSLWKIALKTRNTIASLKKKNPGIKNINLIYPGQKINY